MTAVRIELGTRSLILDPSGAAFCEASGLLVVADLHLETGSAFARRGLLLPPYDTAATLHRLEALITRLRPSVVVSLGDAFHDAKGHLSLPAMERRLLQSLCGKGRWIWISGNHDPLPPEGLAGEALAVFVDGDLVCRHVPKPGPTTMESGFEIAGHLHPKALAQGTRLRLRRPCFLSDGSRLVLPAFGSYTGGLNALDDDVSGLFAGGYDAYLLGKDRVFRLAHHQLLAEPPSPRMDVIRHLRLGVRHG
ncbi:putative phosphoesterase [Arboricoccus pini]|uniref:Putative phosphoesterase n=1 Tax=Arboricoccus pini TaxID=1963835 RepID=A0A212QP36_9PROT|nr:ligase-associated DNA damage response endonuclease PdeM [Arboricoccus pini]SNB61216.1 putative phosphoesterase [Arboricoccus pini]